MKKVKITADQVAAEFLKEFFQRIGACEILKGFEVEHLVLLEWNRKNYLKLQFEKKYKASLLPHEAISLKRIISRIGLTDPMTAISRDGICHQIETQIYHTAHD